MQWKRVQNNIRVHYTVCCSGEMSYMGCSAVCWKHAGCTERVLCGVEWKGVIWSPVQCWSAREVGYMGRSMGALVPALYCLPTLPDDEQAGADGDGDGDGDG